MRGVTLIFSGGVKAREAFCRACGTLAHLKGLRFPALRGWAVALTSRSTGLRRQNARFLIVLVVI